jgi:hypothetical protein
MKWNCTRTPVMLGLYSYARDARDSAILLISCKDSVASPSPYRPLVKVGSIPTRATTYTFLPTSTFSTYFSIAFAFPMITIRFNGFVPDIINTLITKGGTHVRLGEFVE